MGQLSTCMQLSVWIFLICSTIGNSDVDNITYDGDTADGEMLVNLGKRMQKPLLTLIGMAIRNQHPCSEWAQWTSCAARIPRHFGIKKRTRTCSTHNSTGVNALRKLEEDLSVCVGAVEAVCPSDYTLTINGYCLKFYALSKNWSESDKICRYEGGSLVYIDSDAKFVDVKKMLEGVNAYIWINGRRNNTSSPWLTSHGDKLIKFYWMASQPNNAPDELCIVLYTAATREWHDAGCWNTASFICELTQ